MNKQILALIVLWVIFILASVIHWKLYWRKDMNENT